MGKLNYRIPNTNDFKEIYVKVTDTLPIGAVCQYGGSTAPSGYLMCNGQAVSRTTYADLFKAIGTSFGSGDGVTTFNLPNFNGRVPVGLDGTDTDFDTLGETGGEKTHNHTLDSGYAGIGMYLENNATNVYLPKSGATFTGTKYTNGGSTGEGGTSTITTVNAAQLLGTTDNESSLQPYLVVHYIIKATKKVALDKGNVVDSLDGSDTDSAPSVRAVNSLITTQTETINVGTFTALGEKYNQTYTLTLPSGYTSFGVLGYVLSGGGFTNLYLNELYVDGNTLHYSIKNGINAATSTITFTVYVGLIKSS